MANTNLSAVTTTSMNTTVDNYSVDSKQTDGISDQEETYWDNPYFTKWHGYYKTIPELKKAVDALAIWVLGKGYDADPETTVILDTIKGWGEDTFNSIMWNMLVTKKVNGDAYAEIIRDEKSGQLVNIKPLDPSTIRVVVGPNGLIKRYEQRSKTGKKSTVTKFKPSQILHLSNERFADEIHGTSSVESCETVILARNEAMSDWKKVLHRNVIPVRIIEVDEDNAAKLNTLKTQYETAINKGEVLIVPKGNVEIKETVPGIVDPLPTIKYYENFFYQALGIPKIILGGSEEFTEASSKIAYLTFEQVYAREQKELEDDIWNQLFLRVKYRRPASLQNELLTSDEKNTGQTGFQPNDTQINSGAA